ncbi:hypothetical protein SELMODRAFT_232763 [Selaginella moellendorffii]|uniref:Peroxidase n=1 Tax=Selaginella moellendorffii TaxID=88036 RepID=D8RZB3_SELML|nr:hypothetical protein SELMODRAFT_232763 [Selaginella moellendorffii]
MDAAAGGLTPGFYQQSCPNAESMTRSTVQRLTLLDPTLSAALVRLVFHDCQVQGCDGSILLATTKNQSFSPVTTSELASSNNFGIRRLDAIDRIKSVLEASCPGVVSCADIVVMAARDAIALSGGPTIPILTGRRDGTTASAKQADDSLFPPQTPLDRVLSVFQSQGLDTVDTVALLGGHTLGVSHCPSVVNRLYPRMDSSLPLGFGASLRLRCPATIPMNNLSIIANDFTNLAFDNRFYSDVIAGTGVLTVDQQLASDPRTRGIVNQFAADRAAFFRAFARGFQKMSHLNVLTSNAGQVRRSCRTAN